MVFFNWKGGCNGGGEEVGSKNGCLLGRSLRLLKGCLWGRVKIGCTNCFCKNDGEF